MSIKNVQLLLSLIVTTILVYPVISFSCTSILVGKSVTVDGSVLHAHNEDMGIAAVGRLWSVKEALHKKGEELFIPYARIDQAEKTFQYWASGNTSSSKGLGISTLNSAYDSVLFGMNRFGVTVSCNWMWSREKNMKGKGIRRYAIRQLILERATTARDAVTIIGDIIDHYGQADWGGLAYCLADPNEAWIVETTTRNWVARRIKDNEILVVANRFTIAKDYDLRSSGLIEFAIQKGWYDPSERNFNFRQVYGRPEKMDQPYDKDREKRVVRLLENKKGIMTPEDLMLVLRDRYYETSKFSKPLQEEIWRDLSEERGISRPIATNLCQSSMVAHLRNNLPVEVGAVMWYAMAVPYYSGYFPLYAGSANIPDEYSTVHSDYSPDSAWWVFRMLQKVGDRNYEFSYAMVHNFWTAHHAVLIGKQMKLEQRVSTLLTKNRKKEALEVLDRFTTSQAAQTLYHARRLLQLLRDRQGSDPDED